MAKQKLDQQISSASTNIVISNKWTTVLDENILTPERRKQNYIVVEREPAVMVIPIIKVQNEHFTYLVKEYRYPIDRHVWNFPIGSLEPSQDPLKQAEKELSEETGLMTRELIHVGDFFVDPGLSRQKCIVYIANQIIEGGVQRLEETEKGMVAKKFSIPDLETLIEKNENISGWMYSGWYFLQKYMQNSA